MRASVRKAKTDLIEESGMSSKSKIEWTDSTWSPVTGCDPISQGCKNCYAKREVETRWSKNPKSVWYGRPFNDVRCHPEQLNAPLRWKDGRKIFVCPRADLFHDSVPFEFIASVFWVMWNAPQHTFQILTKRADRMKEFIDLQSDAQSWPLPNVWLGVTAENQETADERIQLLLKTPAAVRFVSAEPLLGSIDFVKSSDAWYSRGYAPWRNTPVLTGIHWLIVGGESGPKARPMHPDWVRALRDQCQAAGVPFFLKQWGEWWPAGKDPDRVQQATLHYGPNVRCYSWPNGETVVRIGKKAAGRELDGRTWEEMPA